MRDLVRHLHFRQFLSLTADTVDDSDSFGSNQLSHLMSHTPTTSSMLAPLQQELYTSGPLDPSSTGFGADNYGLPPFMDTSGAQSRPLSGTLSLAV